MSQHATKPVVSRALRERMLLSVGSPNGRELVAALVAVGDDLGSAIEKLAYEYKYRCVVDDEMGPANAPSALELSANLEQSLLEAKQVLEAESGKQTARR